MANFGAIAGLLLVSSATTAMAGGPPIAYAKESGYTFELFLTNPDGTGTVKLYTSPNKVSISHVDIRPGGNQLAIVESSGGGVLKIIHYSDTGVVSSVATVANPGCVIRGIDYHPTNGSLLVSRHCNQATIKEYRLYSNGAYESAALLTASDVYTAFGRWLGDGSGFLWAAGSPNSGGEIRRSSLSSSSAWSTVWRTGTMSTPGWFDVARCSTGVLNAGCSKFLVTDETGGIHRVRFDDFGGTDEGIIFTNAADGHFSPNNSEILYRLQTKSTYQLLIAGPNPRTLVSRGRLLGKDWRN